MGKSHASQYANFGSLHFIYGKVLLTFRGLGDIDFPYHYDIK